MALRATRRATAGRAVRPRRRRAGRCCASYQSCAASSIRSEGELVHEQERGERGEPVEPLRERPHVMEDAPGDDRVPPARLELLEARPDVPRRPRARRGRRRAPRSRARRAPARRRPRSRSRPRARAPEPGAGAARTKPVKSTVVSLAEARRIAVRAQALDGSAVRWCSRPFGDLASCSSTQSLSSRPRSILVPLEPAGGRWTESSSTGCSGRSGSSFEWRAFVYPVEDLPLLKARMRRRASAHQWGDHADDRFLRENRNIPGCTCSASWRRRGPLLSREIEDHHLATTRGSPVVGRAQDGADARDPRRPWGGGGRRPAREASASGTSPSAGIRRPGRFAGRRAETLLGGEAVPGARRPLRGKWAHGSHIRTPARRPPPPTASPSSRPSTGSSTTATRAEALSELPLPPGDVRAAGRNGSTATTCCRSCAGTGSSDGSSRCSTAASVCSG